MEKLTADLKEQSEKQFKIWTPWFLYGDSENDAADSYLRHQGSERPLSTHHSFPGHCTVFFACPTENGKWQMEQQLLLWFQFVVFCL